MKWIVVAALVVTGTLAAVGVVALLVSRDELPPGDGDLIAYGCSEPKNVWYAVCVIRVDGTERRRLTTRLQGSTPVYVVNTSAGVSRRLTRTPGVYEAAPSWSPDGSQIAFARWTIADLLLDGATGIFVMNRGGSGERLVLEHKNVTGGLYSLAWSPDGRTLAFETSPNLECTAISLVDVESGAVRPLTSCTRQRESSGSPAWQPDAAVEER